MPSAIAVSLQPKCSDAQLSAYPRTVAVPEGLADDTQRADLLAGPCVAAAPSHSLVAELAGCVHVTLRDQMLPVSPIFGLALVFRGGKSGALLPC